MEVTNSFSTKQRRNIMNGATDNFTDYEATLYAGTLTFKSAYRAQTPPDIEDNSGYTNQGAIGVVETSSGGDGMYLAKDPFILSLRQIFRSDNTIDFKNEATALNVMQITTSSINMYEDLTIDSGTSTNVDIVSNDAGASTLSLYGANQGTGRLYVGQSSTYGGGIEYNGNNSPTTTGAGSDYITLWRRSNGNDYWTAKNLHSSND